MLKLDTVHLTLGDFSLRADLAFHAPITALIGPSGAGKSTLLGAIAGFTPVASGRIQWRDLDIADLPPAKRPVGMIFQDNNLFPHLTIADNLALALTTGRPNAEQRDRIAGVLTRVGLPGLAARKPAQLSGGQQSRAALARVLLQARPLLLLDEPFAALGPALRFEMLDLVADIAARDNLQVLMVSHAPADALRIASETSVIADGEVSPPHPTQSLFEAPPPRLQSYLGPPD